MNLPDFAKICTFYTKYFKVNSKCFQCRFKAFQNEIKILIFNFGTFKRILILIEFDKLGNLPNLEEKFGNLA